MTDTAAPNTAQTEGTKDSWVSRFGTLADVTERQGVKGPYVTFKLDAKGFAVYGVAFKAEVVEAMKAAIGQRVWMKGPQEIRQVTDTSGETAERRSFKVVYFRVQEQAGGGTGADSTESAAAPVDEDATETA